MTPKDQQNFQLLDCNKTRHKYMYVGRRVLKHARDVIRDREFSRDQRLGIDACCPTCKKKKERIEKGMVLRIATTTTNNNADTQHFLLICFLFLFPSLSHAETNNPPARRIVALTLTSTPYLCLHAPPRRRPLCRRPLRLSRRSKEDSASSSAPTQSTSSKRLLPLSTAATTTTTATLSSLAKQQQHGMSFFISTF